MCDLSDEEQLGTARLRQQAQHRRTEQDARAPEFWVAGLDTRHFSFEAYGLTEESCRDAMRRAVTAHVIENFRCDGALRQANIDGLMTDVQPQRRSMGEGYRDGQCQTGGR